MSLEQDVNQLEQAFAQFERARGEIESDTRFIPEAKAIMLAEHDAKVSKEIEPKRNELEQQLSEQLSRDNAEHMSLLEGGKIVPQNLDEWQLASATAPFLKEDLSNDTNGLENRFDAAIKAGRTVEAFLLKRYGAAALEAAKAPDRASAFRAMVDKAEKAHVDQPMVEAVLAQRARTSKLLSRVRGLLTATEEEKIKQRYGIR